MNHLKSIFLAFLALCLGGLPVVAQESDPRLHPNGPGWRIDKADTENPDLPRVMLIGDSICNGYMNIVRRALRNYAEVDAWVQPYYQAYSGLDKMVHEVLSTDQYAVVHFNMGLHGWRKGQFKDGEFKPATAKLVENIRKGAPNATLIWADSTPVTTKTKPFGLDPDINPIIVEQNHMAAEVMRDMGVPVNDLYALLVSHLDMAAGDQFHWRAPAYDILAKKIVTSLAAPLKLSEAQLAAAFKRIDEEPDWFRAKFRINIRSFGDARMEYQSGDKDLRGELPVWAGTQGSYLLVMGPITRKWRSVTFTFLPTVSGKVSIAFVGDSTPPRELWSAYCGVWVQGAELLNGDFSQLDPAGRPLHWDSHGRFEAGKGFDDKNLVMASGTAGFSQDITIEAGKPVTVTFHSKIGNYPESN